MEKPAFRVKNWQFGWEIPGIRTSLTVKTCPPTAKNSFFAHFGAFGMEFA